MKVAALILAALPLLPQLTFAQIGSRPTPTAAAVAPTGGSLVTQGKSTRIPLSSFVNLERTFDGKLQATADAAGPVDLLGATRGIYLDGYGVVFTSEMGLIVTPTVNPFNQTITDAQKTRVHSAKVSRLPAVRKAIQEMARAVATNMAQIPENQQVVIAVRLDYATWENTSGLPGLIVAKADRRSAMANNIQLEEQ